MRATESRTRRFIEAEGDAVDTRIAELLRSLPSPEPLGPAELARVAARLESRPAPRLPALRYALLLATGMLAGTGFAVASYGVQRFIDEPRAVVPAPAPPVEPPAPTGRARAHRPSVEAPPAAPEQDRGFAPPAIRHTTPSDAATSSLGREAELLSRALTKLRRDRDARAALALLDQYYRDFPLGSLRLEADVARVDALIALGQSSEALALLDRLPIDRLGRGAELRVVRGELRAQREPASALADFDRALAVDLTPELAERALFGRAAIRLRSGDETRGRADLEAYLARFPNGRFASEARRRLQ